MLASTLLFGVILGAYPAQASFLSSLFGEASANSKEVLSGVQDTGNSQTLALLEANVPPVSLVNKDKKSTTEGEIDGNVAISISDNALVPTVNSLDIGGSDTDGEAFSDQVSIYVIRKGDSIAQIAKMFGVSVNTIYWVNDLKKGDKLKEGETLIILPFDGLTHVVKPKETLAGIAKLYKADASEIIAFNGLDKDAKIAVGDELVIPDGQKIEESPKPVKKPSTNTSNIANSRSNLKSADGYFAYPLPSGPRIRKTQGLHGNGGIDIGAPSGTPIYASASGTVVFAKTGYNGGYGTLVILKHSNGTETRYAHMSKLGTSAGRQVSQGEVIGYVGTTGRSTGNHLHFEVRGARNPF